MFSPDAPNNTQSPVNINLSKAERDAGVAPINVTNDDGQPLMNITRSDGSGGGSVTIEGGNFFFSETPQSTPRPMTGAGGGGSGSVVPVWG